MPTVYMMIGVPGSGKSTWLKKWLNEKQQNEYFVYSTDDWIEGYARQKGKTYDQVFCDGVYKAAKKNRDQCLKRALNSKYDIYWDQTNTTAKQRQKKLAAFGPEYEKVAVFFPTPDDEELARRHAQRPGKAIPDFVMKTMKEQLEKPTLSEGFDTVITVRD